jgi:hypothetical protein
MPITVIDGPMAVGKTHAMLVKMILLSLYDVPGVRVLVGSYMPNLGLLVNRLRVIVGESNVRYKEETGELLLLGQEWRVLAAHWKDSGREDDEAYGWLAEQDIGIAILCVGNLLPERFVKMAARRIQNKRSRMYLVADTHWFQSSEDAMYRSWLRRDFIENKELQESGMVRREHFTLADAPRERREKFWSWRDSCGEMDWRRYWEGEWVDVPRIEVPVHFKPEGIRASAFNMIG